MFDNREIIQRAKLIPIRDIRWSRFLPPRLLGLGSEGRKASEYAKATFPSVMESVKDAFLENPIDALKDAYERVHSQMCDDHEALDTYMSGTTCSMVIIRDNTLYTSNVGDSRVLLGQKSAKGAWTGLQLSVDHTCNNAIELDRVMASGARVEQLLVGETMDGVLRIFKGSLPYPGLAVTRTLGDSVATKLGVLSVPEVFVHQITYTDRFLILASDGVWDGLNIDEVIDITQSNLDDPSKASKLLTKKSIVGMQKRQMDDNSTNIVVVFDN